MLDPTEVARGSIADEFGEAELGDVRRTRRLQRIAERAMEAPRLGFPQMVNDDSELEGLYRFFGSESVDFDNVLKPHVDATFRRMRLQEGPVLVIHDTTDLKFGGMQVREGLGTTYGKQQGFLIHVALAVLPGEERLPLGTCGLQRICRLESKNTRQKSWYQMSKDPTRESLRWGQLAMQVERAGEGIDCIHLMDREGDNFDLLALLVERKARFVVRGCHDRALTNGHRLEKQIEGLVPQTYREIQINERIDDGRRKDRLKSHPPRSARSARVAVAGCSVALRRTLSAHSEQREVTLNVVRVWEASPPKGEPPVFWTLYTSEPIDTAEQVIAVVDYYRSRWVIEEFFKALKTGCSIEKRQLESYAALSVALAVFLPVAWKLLLARSLSRKVPNAPATTVASDIQLNLLRHKLNLDALPKTAEQATLAIAKLGGHLKRNGPPGWLTLGRGLESLLLMQAGWYAAMAAQRCDQS
jgi:hypothetical protein